MEKGRIIFLTVSNSILSPLQLRYPNQNIDTARGSGGWRPNEEYMYLPFNDGYTAKVFVNNA